VALAQIHTGRATSTSAFCSTATRGAT